MFGRQGYHNLMAEACQQLGVNFSELGTYEEVPGQWVGRLGDFFRMQNMNSSSLPMSDTGLAWQAKKATFHPYVNVPWWGLSRTLGPQPQRVAG